MTSKQKTIVQKYAEEHKQNCKDFAAWGSARDCSFNVYKSENSEDKNVTIVMTIITGLSDDYQTYVETVNLMVEPDGNTINLMDVFKPEQVLDYVGKLIKV